MKIMEAKVENFNVTLDQTVCQFYLKGWVSTISYKDCLVTLTNSKRVDASYWEKQDLEYDALNYEWVGNILSQS